MILHHGILGAFAVLAGLALMTASPLGAQTNPAPAEQSPATGAVAREGNVYDYQRHQPTAADLGAAPLSDPDAAAVDGEVRKFLKRMDALDRKAEELEDEGR